MPSNRDQRPLLNPRQRAILAAAAAESGYRGRPCGLERATKTRPQPLIEGGGTCQGVSCPWLVTPAGAKVLEDIKAGRVRPYMPNQKR